MLECELVTSKTVVHPLEEENAPRLLDRQVAVAFVRRKHRGPTPAADIPPQTMVLCGNLTLDFVQPGLSVS